MPLNSRRPPFEPPETFGGRLWATVQLLVMLPCFGLIWMAVGTNKPMVDPPWDVVGRFVLQTVGAFWALCLLFLWWRPAWLKRLTDDAARGVNRLMIVFTVGMLALLLAGAARGLWEFFGPG
ncbi:MAG: hypothetical protein AAF907_06505 [Planctomycetota bacterium]